VSAKLAFFHAGLELAGNSYLSTVVHDLTPAMHRYRDARPNTVTSIRVM
jgi:hypothetical protein